MENLGPSEDNWSEIKNKLKQKIALLSTSEDAEGKKEELLGRLQLKLGKTKEEIEKLISGL
jgi:uncharacterized protein YjbJ (UPF0337 family)